MVAACGIGAEIAAAMRGNDLEPGEAIERSLEDQVLQGDRGVEWIADGVRQPAVALETLASSGVLCGWMNSTAPSSSALAQTGSNFGSEKSSPSTLPPIAAPRRPCFLTAVSSCCTARSGYCNVSEAKAANRSGRAAQSSASFSF